LRAVIVANGVMESETDIAFWAKEADVIVAADGGTNYCYQADIIPDLVIGDLDSTSPDILNWVKQAGKEIRSYPVEKDYTDLELALRHVAAHGAEEIVILGALGARWDMSLANLMLLGADFMADLKVRLVDGPQEAFLLKGGKSTTIHGEAGDLISLIPLGRDALEVTTEGLRYPLNHETLYFAATRGVSNRLISNVATICLGEGLLICLHQRNAARLS